MGVGSRARFQTSTYRSKGALSRCAQDADDRRTNRKENSDSKNAVDPLRDVRDRMTEEIAAQDHGSHPKNAAENVERNVAPVRHPRRARNRRTKRANDRNKPRENNGAAAVLLVEIMRPLQMAAPKEKRIFAPVECRSRRAPDPVANLVAYDSAGHHRQKQELQRNYAAGGKNARSDEQGISGEEKADKKARFDKNDCADERGAARAD